MFVARDVSPGIVRLEFSGDMSAEDEAAYLETLEELSTREVPFVVVAMMAGRRPLSPEGKKRQALWFKRSREHLRAHCRGLVRVSGDDAAAEPGTAALVAALPFPLAHAASETEAMRVARRLLAEDP